MGICRVHSLNMASQGSRSLEKDFKEDPGLNSVLL